VFIEIRYQLLQLKSIQIALLTIWALMMVSLPIADWSTGWSAMIGAITVGVSVTAGLVIALLWGVWGAAATLRVAGSILALSWAAEAIGSRTGIPFGTYNYTDTLQPQILNVPIQIPLGWLLVSALITILIRPGKLPVAPLLIIYTAIWLLKSAGLGFFWDILGAAIVGSFFMGSITIFAWRAFIRRD
jgi:uncharacterized membrane protein